MAAWPSSADELEATQVRLGRLRPPSLRPAHELAVGGVFVCFPRGPTGPGAAGDRAWAGAALIDLSGRATTAVVEGTAGEGYAAGLLALREGELFEAAVRSLAEPPEIVLVDATGRDHPRGAGLALHLGAVLDVPTIGVTHRPLLANGDWPADERGAWTPLLLGDEVVGVWLRTKRGARPLAVHAAWRTEPRTAADVVLAMTAEARTPEPLRLARRAARTARARASQSP